MQTENVGHRSDGSVATRVLDQDWIWRPIDRDVRITPTHGKIESISEKLAYRKFIKDPEIETRKVFERENIENIGTRLDDQMTRSVDSSKRSKKHAPEVNLDPDPSSSDSSDLSSSEPRELLGRSYSKASIFQAPAHADRKCRSPERWKRRYQSSVPRQNMEAYRQGR